MLIRTARDLGLVARQRRLDEGLSQKEVAQGAGVTRQWLSRFESGNSEVAFAKAFAVLRELSLVVRVVPSGSLRPSGAGSERKFVIPTIETPAMTTSATDLAAMRERLASLGVSSDVAPGRRSGP